MLKFIISVFISATLLSNSYAETKKFIFKQDSLEYEAIVTMEKHAGTVYFYQAGKLLGQYDNLIINEPAIFSYIVPIVGGVLRYK